MDKSEGLTPLVHALNFNFVDGVDLLIKYKADVNFCMENNFTALHYAAKNNQQ